MKRCDWCEINDLERAYHDTEWGTPVHDDKKLFEFLVLEGAQAGLSWDTILKRRDGYRNAFDNYDLKKIINYNTKKIEELMNNPNIIRNRLKINSVIINAKLFLEIQKEFGSFDKYLWSFVNNKQIINKPKIMKEIPTSSKESDAISTDLKRRGFKFVGTTIIYAYMQAVGLVDDHLTTCYKKNKK